MTNTEREKYEFENRLLGVIATELEDHGRVTETAELQLKALIEGRGISIDELAAEEAEG